MYRENIVFLLCLLHFVVTFCCYIGYPEFGCPETAKYHPAEDFSCQEKIYASLMNQVS